MLSVPALPPVPINARPAGISTNAAVAEQIAKLRQDGFSLREVAVTLNGAGHTTATGKAWHAMAVSRVLAA